MKFLEVVSKTFSKSIRSKSAGKEFSSVYRITSYIKLVFSPMYVPLINPV